MKTSSVAELNLEILEDKEIRYFSGSTQENFILSVPYTFLQVIYPSFTVILGSLICFCILMIFTSKENFNDVLLVKPVVH